MKKLLLISNSVMHYRISVYNYFWREFKDSGWELLVRCDEVQKEILILSTLIVRSWNLTSADTAKKYATLHQRQSYCFCI